MVHGVGLEPTMLSLGRSALQAEAIAAMQPVQDLDPTGFEPITSVLSGLRSSQLS